MSQAILFDRERVERLGDLSERPQRLGSSRLLWVDVDRVSDDDAARVAESFGLDDETRAALARSSGKAVFRDRGSYLHLTAFAPDEERDGELVALECVVGASWVVTAHDQPVPVLDEFAERTSGSGDTGSLDGPSFLATLLEWVLGSYSAAFERIEARLERFDVEAMRGDGDAERHIERLVELRQQVGNLRRALAAHRSLLVSLRHPELEPLGDEVSGERFQNLLFRFESTMQEARDAREAIVGSFDVLIARGGHRTNEIMKVLTLVSVMLLPGALIAGVMGMNFKAGLFTHPGLFWVVAAAIAAFVPATLVVAKARNWI